MEILDLSTESSKEKFKKLDPETIRQLFTAYVQGYMWKGLNKTIGFSKDGSIIFFDLEQPNRFTAEQSFLKNIPLYEIYTLGGLESFLQTFKDYGTKEQYELVKSLVLTDPILKAYNQYQSRIDRMKKIDLL